MDLAYLVTKVVLLRWPKKKSKTSEVLFRHLSRSVCCVCSELTWSFFRTREAPHEYAHDESRRVLYMCGGDRARRTNFSSFSDGVLWNGGWGGTLLCALATSRCPFLLSLVLYQDCGFFLGFAESLSIQIVP